MESENFEGEVKQMLRELAKRNPLLGLPVKEEAFTKTPTAKAPSKKKKPKKVKADKKKENSFLLSMIGKRK